MASAARQNHDAILKIRPADLSEINTLHDFVFIFQTKLVQQGKAVYGGLEAPTATRTRLSRNLGQVLLFDRCRAAGLARVCSALLFVLYYQVIPPNRAEDEQSTKADWLKAVHERLHYTRTDSEGQCKEQRLPRPSLRSPATKDPSVYHTDSWTDVF